MSQLNEPVGEPPERHRARLIAGGVLLAAVVALLIAAAVRATSPASTTGAHQAVTRDGVSVSLEIDSNGALAGSTVSGKVVVVNNSGHDIGAGGPGSCASQAFVVNLDDGHGHRTDDELSGTCRDGYKFPTGTTTDDVKVPAVGGDGQPLPAGAYSAVLTVGPAYPLPVPGPVPLTIKGA